MKKIAKFLLLAMFLYLSAFFPRPAVLAAASPTITLDQHLDGTYVQDVLHISGTASNTSGVCYMVDSSGWNYADWTSQGTSANYSKDIDVSGLTTGSHTITIATWGGLAQVSFTVNKAAPVISAFSPKNNLTYAWGQAIPVTGFAEFPEGTRDAQICLDGQNWIFMDSNTESDGLNDYFHGAYKNADSSGFSYTIPPKTLSPGVHIIGLAAYGYAHKDAVVTTVTINVAVVPSAIQVDQNLDNTYAHGDVNISGTAFNASNIAYICTNIQGQGWVFADWDLQKGSIQSTVQYTASISLSSLHTGVNVVSVAVRGKDDSLSQTTFTVIKADSLMRFFTPDDNAFYLTSKDITVGGFAEFPEGMRDAQICLDGRNWEFMNYNTGTQGLDSYFHGAYKNAENSGFLYTIPKGSLSIGTHIIGIAAYGNAGERLLTSITFTITGNLPASSSNLSQVIDISHYTTTDWNQLSGGIGAVYIKATEGANPTTDYAIDSKLGSNVAGAQSRGLPYGMYHFLRFNETGSNQDAAAQADAFYNAIKNYGYTCVPVLDVEYTYDKNGNPCAPNLEGAYTGQQIANMISSFINRFNAISGNRGVMVYANPNMINSYLVWANDSTKAFLSQQRLWLADYGSYYNDTYYYPVAPNPISYHTNAIWSHWDMWQYTSNLVINGVAGKADGDWATDNIFLK